MNKPVFVTLALGAAIAFAGPACAEKGAILGASKAIIVMALRKIDIVIPFTSAS